MADKSFLQIKSELLCKGIKMDKEAKNFYEEYNPYKSKKTGNTALSILLENKLVVFVSTTHEFDKNSPFNIKKKNGKWILLKRGKEVCKIDMIKMPKWYSKKTSRGTPMSSVFLHEGVNFLHQTYQGCDYFKIGKPCKFCGTGGIWKNPDPKDVGETAAEAYKENKKYQVCLGGGTHLIMGKSTAYLLKCVNEIRKQNEKIPIWVEMVPPEDNSYIQKLIYAGANAFGFNIEIWNDKLRKYICPGKYSVSKERYFDAFKYVNKKLGPNKICTILIVGIQPRKDILEGVKVMTKMGVKVCILSFKPWDNSVFRNKPACSPKELLWISEKTGKLMKKNNIDCKQNFGCANCSGCGLESDF